MLESCIKNWSDIAKEFEESDILIGNGFSINIYDGFKYESIYQKAKELDNEKVKLLDKFGINDFEKVLKNIDTSIKVNDALEKEVCHLVSAYNDIKDLFSNAILKIHPKQSNVKSLDLVNSELEKYKNIFTTNYDLLIYWSIMENKSKIKDYFWNSECIFDINNSKPNGIAVHYLHGALHLEIDDFLNVKKVISEPGLPIIEKIISRNRIPMIVNEGTSDEKIKKIRNNEYLNFCYEKLSKSNKNLVIIGHSLSKNDSHIIRAASQFNEIQNTEKKVAISIHDKQKIREIYLKAKPFDENNCKVFYFHASTHPLGSPNLKVQ